jgi:hypothetical protein
MTAEHTHINHSLSPSTCTISHATVPMPISKPIPTTPTFQKGAAKSEKKHSALRTFHKAAFMPQTSSVNDAHMKKISNNYSMNHNNLNT